MGCGSGMTCWRRLRDWQAAGVFERLHRVLLDQLGAANAIDWSRCSLDTASVAAKTYGPPRRQVVWVGWAEQSAKTYPASRANLGPRWRSARAGPPKGDGV